MNQIAFSIGLMAAAQLFAQTATDGIKLGDVDFTATRWAREYVRNRFEPTANYNNQYAYSANLLRLNFAETRGALVLRPHSKITISSEAPSLRLTAANDLWYSGGRVYQPWSFGYTGRAVSGNRWLANLYDTSVEYSGEPAHDSSAYLGHVRGKAVMHEIYPEGVNGQFGYLEAVLPVGRNSK